MLNPMTWTNYFPLKKNNIRALELQMAYLPEFPHNVYWDESYKHLYGPQRDDFSDWQVLLKHPFPALGPDPGPGAAAALHFVRKQARRQRLIPPKPVLANTSLDFAETLGRLYTTCITTTATLANKMTQHLLEYIRQNYYLNTSAISTEFVTALSRKSGQPREFIEQLMNMVMEVKLAGSISDEQLQQYYNSIIYSI